MAIEVRIETTIDVPPAVVFDRVAGLEGWPGWLVASGIRRVERRASGPPAAGEELIVEQQAAGRSGTFAATITSLEPGRQLTLHGKDGDGVQIDIDSRIEPAAGGTRLHWSVRIALPLRYRVFESMARPQVERAAGLDIEGLKRSLEGAAKG